MRGGGRQKRKRRNAEMLKSGGRGIPVLAQGAGFSCSSVRKCLAWRKNVTLKTTDFPTLAKGNPRGRGFLPGLQGDRRRHRVLDRRAMADGQAPGHICGRTAGTVAPRHREAGCAAPPVGRDYRARRDLRGAKRPEIREARHSCRAPPGRGPRPVVHSLRPPPASRGPIPPGASGCGQAPPRNPDRLTPRKTTANQSRPYPAATINLLVAWLR